MKICITCNKLKHESDFYKQSKSNNTQNECKECCKKRQEQRRLTSAKKKKHLHVCSKCGKESQLPKDIINRKVYKDLCGDCAQTKNYEKGALRKIDTSPKKWDEVYNDPLRTGNTLKEARELELTYYKRNCPKHGPMPYATLDQSCRKCSNERAKKRCRENPDFNRPRVILASIRRRAKIKNLEFNLEIEDIRNNIPERCPVLNILTSYDDNYDTSPSVDRLDSAKGYTKDNIQIISNRANRLKNNGSAEEHIKIAVWQLSHEGKTLNEIRNIVNHFIGEG